MRPRTVYGSGLGGAAYRELCAFAAAGEPRSPRGTATRDAGPVLVDLDAMHAHVFSGSARSTDLAYLAAEARLFAVGEVRASEYARHASLWGRIANPDGEINSAYGHRIWHRRFYEHRGGQRDRQQRTQWEQAYRTLKADPDSRRAVLTLNLPEDHWEGNRDVPCTLAISLQRGPDGCLDANVTMRSWDVWFGVPYDVPFFAAVARRMATELGLGIGRVRVMAWSLHAYDDRFTQVQATAADDTQEEVAWSDLPPGLAGLLVPPQGVLA